jgi:LmbE family N-acetylglucosaminyl deacetylase
VSADSNPLSSPASSPAGNPGRPLVVLSPHLDDAVLSCGGRIAHAVEGGRRVFVATIFTKDEPAEPPSALAADLRRWWKLPAGEVMARRRAEDLEACRRLGAEPRHLDLAEAPYRFDGESRVLYATLGALFGAVAGADAACEAEIADRIAALERELGGGAGERPELLGPLGVGNHVDHQLARRALERVRPEAALYEEFPYTEWKWFAVSRTLRAGSGGSDWTPETLPIDEGLFERKRQAILAYVSQVPTLFRSEGRLAKQLRRARRRSGGERIWRRR